MTSLHKSGFQVGIKRFDGQILILMILIVHFLTCNLRNQCLMTRARILKKEKQFTLVDSVSSSSFWPVSWCRTGLKAGSRILNWRGESPRSNYDSLGVSSTSFWPLSHDNTGLVVRSGILKREKWLDWCWLTFQESDPINPSVQCSSLGVLSFRICP